MWVTVVRHYHSRAHCITLCIVSLIFVNQRTPFSLRRFVSLRRCDLKISIWSLKISTSTLKISDRRVVSLRRFDESYAYRDTFVTGIRMFFEFCGQGGASVFTTNSLTNYFSNQICLKLEPLEFLLLSSLINTYLIQY